MSISYQANYEVFPALDNTPQTGTFMYPPPIESVRESAHAMIGEPDQDWLKEFRNIITGYSRNRAPDPFMTWFRERDSEGFFKNDYERVLVILIDARFDQRTTAEKALENTVTVVEHGALKKPLAMTELQLLIPRQNVSAANWTKLFCDALPAMNSLSTRIVSQRVWDSAELLDLMRDEFHVPYLGTKTARLAVRWLHELVSAVTIRMSTFKIPVDSLVFRVCSRLGIIDPSVDEYSGEGSIADEKIQRFAVRAFPDKPWLLDEPLWSTGRRADRGGHCFPRAPNCSECLFERICQKRFIDVDPGKLQVFTGRPDARQIQVKSKITDQQSAFAKFVDELKQRGIRGQAYREQIMRWEIEHGGK